MIKNVVLNSFKRTGNTFLSNAIELSYFANDVNWEEYRINSHMHNMFVHRIPQSEDFYQVTMIRNPADTIVSAALFDGHYLSYDINSVEGVEFLCNQTVILYNLFYDEWLKNKNSKMIRFEDLTSDVNSVLKSIYSDLGIEYKNDIDSERVKNKIALSDSNTKENLFTGHIPRNVNSLAEYEKVKNCLLSLDKYKESVDIYEQIMEAL